MEPIYVAFSALTPMILGCMAYCFCDCETSYGKASRNRQNGHNLSMDNYGTSDNIDVASVGDGVSCGGGSCGGGD